MLQQTNASVKMVDIRAIEEYEKQHIPRVMNIPAEHLNDNLIVFDREDIIVCICTHGKERSQQAAELLYHQGFKNTFYLLGGTAGWLNQETPLAKASTDISLLHLEAAMNNREN
ncbi:rhodanese-like domain-containing protein [Ilyomonas limi]|uniref:rhodanese-like domain-containing protein n=1 Tax=Ilyomonas limi TaxID=2575867 RepID=UPI001484EBC6|nr:rhodanese-like domain-containing protein [Ilyomonas limi]